MYGITLSSIAIDYIDRKRFSEAGIRSRRGTKCLDILPGIAVILALLDYEFVFVIRLIVIVIPQWAIIIIECRKCLGDIQLSSVLNVFDFCNAKLAIIFIYCNRSKYILINNVSFRCCLFFYIIGTILHTRKGDGSISIHGPFHKVTSSISCRSLTGRIRIDRYGSTSKISTRFVNLADLELTKFFLISKCKCCDFLSGKIVITLTINVSLRDRHPFVCTGGKFLYDICTGIQIICRCFASGGTDADRIICSDIFTIRILRIKLSFSSPVGLINRKAIRPCKTIRRSRIIRICSSVVFFNELFNNQPCRFCYFTNRNLLGFLVAMAFSFALALESNLRCIVDLQFVLILIIILSDKISIWIYCFHIVSSNNRYISINRTGIIDYTCNVTIECIQSQIAGQRDTNGVTTSIQQACCVAGGLIYDKRRRINRLVVAVQSRNDIFQRDAVQRHTSVAQICSRVCIYFITLIQTDYQLVIYGNSIPVYLITAGVSGPRIHQLLNAPHIIRRRRNVSGFLFYCSVNRIRCSTRLQTAIIIISVNRKCPVYGYRNRVEIENLIHSKKAVVENIYVEIKCSLSTAFRWNAISCEFPRLPITGH